MRVIGITGEPGSGKTFCVKRIFSENCFDDWSSHKFELLRYHRSESKKTIILGIYDGCSVFDGTDRLSMAVQPSVQKMLVDVFFKDYLILFEGDRLFNCKFLCFIESLKVDFSWFWLNTPSDTCRKQREQRRANQEEAFIRSRKTKIKNISKSHILQTINQSDLFLCLATAYGAE